VKERVAVALDTADPDELARWCRFFGPRVGVLKVGLEAFASQGPAAVAMARRAGARVFLDLKLHDIPNTVAGAVRAARALEVDLLTVHAGGGRAMLEAAADAADGALRLLGVTLLTHLDEAELSRLDLPGPVAIRVERWAGLAAAGGCAGVVCSPQEAAALRARHAAPFLLVTPGVRPAGGAGGDDQRRVATPAAALRAGADLIVVGRPLTRAADPGAALEALLREMSGAQP
jgi:orotidine-5'-phosphate decarboxylase